jgi:hypothetical protein
MFCIKKMSSLFLLFFISQLVLSLMPDTETPVDSPVEQVDSVDEVLVIGEQPGPGLWWVYKGDHVLRVLGTISPIPKNMEWQSKQVDAALAESQEYIAPPSVKVEIGFWGKVGLLPSLIGIKNNPDSKKLVDVLSPELYERWAVLKEKYIGQSQNIEKQRPIFAASELFKKSIEKSNLVSNERVRWRLENVVRDNKIKTTYPRIMHEVQRPRAAIKKFKKSTLDDTQCFAKTLARLESDLDAMRARANAWSVGDINALRNLPYVDNKAACEEAVLNSELAQDQGLQDIKTTLRAAWLEAAETALANNTMTFASLPMEELLNPDGYLAALAAKGYKVEAAE